MDIVTNIKEPPVTKSSRKQSIICTDSTGQMSSSAIETAERNLRVIGRTSGQFISIDFDHMCSKESHCTIMN
jgi:hypothetical protein